MNQNRDKDTSQDPKGSGGPEAGDLELNKTNDAEKSASPNGIQLTKLQQELSEYKDKYMRLVAEFENIRKRNERERMEFVKYANEGLIVQFLDVLDDLERTVQVAGNKHQDYEAFLKGVEMVMAHIYDLLKKHQVRPIETVGKKFDPHCHEVLMQMESDQQDDGTVVEEFQKGYYLADKVVRTAKVKVSISPREEKAKGEELPGPAQEDEQGQ
jgi:molecular chaperone GrpE